MRVKDKHLCTRVRELRNGDAKRRSSWWVCLAHSTWTGNRSKLQSLAMCYEHTTSRCDKRKHSSQRCCDAACRREQTRCSATSIFSDADNARATPLCSSRLARGIGEDPDTLDMYSEFHGQGPGYTGYI
jgi:hypothetical protein